ncbi:hypothetical protein D3C81_2004730 [compost metagenome]
MSVASIAIFNFSEIGKAIPTANVDGSGNSALNLLPAGKLLATDSGTSKFASPFLSLVTTLER